MMYRRGFLALFLILLLGPLTACRDTGGSSALGSMRVVTGTCKLTFKTETKVVSANEKAPVPMGALLETDATGVAVVTWGKTSQILQKNTRLTFVAESKIPGYGVGKVELLKGVASFLLPKTETPDFKFQASCHSIVAAVKGTAFDMSADGDDGPVTIQVTSGTVSVFDRVPGDKATDEKPEDAGSLLAATEKGDVYTTADLPAPGAGAQDLGQVLASGPTGSGRAGIDSGNARPAPGGGAKGAEAVRGNSTSSTRPVKALYNKPLVTGLNKGAIPAGSIVEWEITSRALLENAIFNF